MKIGNLLLNVKDGDMFQGVARLLSRRKMGRICFCDVRFQEDQVQIIFDSSLVNYQEVTSLPLGSLIYVVGKKKVTNSGTPSLSITKADALYVFQDLLPDKYHGLNQSIRYRKRVFDLLVNKDSFIFVKKMSKSLEVIRKIMYEEGFHEFVTGVLQETFEAGQAHAFSTKCRANDKTLHLSLTAELKLKRLLVSGFERVFEIAQSFRNEGIDAIHSPEFTMLEVYESGANYHRMMELLEKIVSEVVKECEDGEIVNYIDNNGNNMKASYKRPFIRLSFRQAFEKIVGPFDNCSLDYLLSTYPDSFTEGMTRFTWLMKVIEKFIVPNINEPTFLTELPVGMSPFVKNSDDKTTTERAFLIAQGVFLADIYSDENGFFKLSESLNAQANETGSELNSEYLEIIKIGLPDTAGIGMGLNRLFMLLLNKLPRNIKETILYPIP